MTDPKRADIFLKLRRPCPNLEKGITLFQHFVGMLILGLCGNLLPRMFWVFAPLPITWVFFIPQLNCYHTFLDSDSQTYFQLSCSRTFLFNISLVMLSLLRYRKVLCQPFFQNYTNKHICRVLSSTGLIKNSIFIYHV